MVSSLPQSVIDLVDLHPVEDLILALLREQMVGVQVGTLIGDDQGFPFLLIRRGGDWGYWTGDQRGLVDQGQVNLHAFCEGINAEDDCYLLAEAARSVLFRARNKVVPGLGHLTKVDVIQAPKREPDWATSSGPVQYADLPTGVSRWEMILDIQFRNVG